MKKTILAVAVCVLAILIVLPVTLSVNHFAGNQATGGTLAADGWPLPGPHSSSSTLVADGWPLPGPHNSSVGFAA